MDKVAEDYIQRFLEKRNVGFTTTDGGYFDHKIVRFRYAAKDLNIDCMIDYSEEVDVFTIYANTSDEFDISKRDEMVKIVNYANQRSRFGAMIAGESEDEKNEKFRIWYRLSNAGAMGTDMDDVIDSMISNACRGLADYYPALMKVVWGDLKAEEAIKFAFNDSDGDDDDDDESTPTPVVTGYE